MKGVAQYRIFIKSNSEGYFKSKLALSRQAGCIRNLSEQRCIHVRERVAEGRMVESVRRFETELDLRALVQTFQRKHFQHGHIRSEVKRCANGSVASGSVAESIKRRQYEDLGVGEVVVDPALRV